MEVVTFVEFDVPDQEAPPEPPDGDGFFAAGMSSPTPLVVGAWGPSGFYDASSNRTWVAWEGVRSAGATYIRASYLSIYDHTEGEWLPQNFLISNVRLTDDAHGMPVIIRDHEGHAHSFHASHNSDQRHASTSVADDPTTFVERTVVSTSLDGNFTYPHPVMVGSTMYLFMRESTVAGNPYMLVVVPTSALTGGVATWGTKVTIANPENTNDRFYKGQCVPDGDGNIHIIGTIADGNDTFRRGVYYLIYNTGDGSVSNWDGSTTVAAGSLPILRSQLDSDFRIVDQGSDYGEIPAFCLDSDGVPHVVYAQDDESTGPFGLIHITVEEGSWTSPVAIGSIPNRFSIPTLIPREGGALDLYYTEDDDGDFDRGGNIVRRSWDGSSWGTPVQVLAATDYGLAVGNGITDAHEDLRILFTEEAGALVEDDDASGPYRVYSYGDSGFLNRSEYDSLFHLVNFQSNFQGSDGATSIADESDRGVTMTFNGNAQIDDQDARFGATSLLLDGTGDYLSNSTQSNWHLEALSFCWEFWVKLASAADMRVISYWPNTPQRSLLVSIDDDIGSARLVRVLITSNGSTTVNPVSGDATPLDDSEWHHLCIERQQNTWRIMIDGAVVGEETNTANVFSSVTTSFRIGDSETGSAGFNGRIGGARFTRGWWRYGGAFTPPDAPFPSP